MISRQMIPKRRQPEADDDGCPTTPPNSGVGIKHACDHASPAGYPQQPDRCDEPPLSSQSSVEACVGRIFCGGVRTRSHTVAVVSALKNPVPGCCLNQEKVTPGFMVFQQQPPYMTQRTPDFQSLTGLHWLGFMLAAITGVIHLWLGVEFIDNPMGWSFLAAGVGYFAAIGLVILNIRRRLVYLLGIPYTAVQIPLWWIVNDIQLADLLEPGIGVFDKLVQVILIGVLVVLYAQGE